MTDIEALNTAARFAHRVLPAATAEIIADDLYEHADHFSAGGNLMPSRLQCAQEILEMVDAGKEQRLAAAVELAGEALSYVPAYFREKWAMDERYRKLAEEEGHRV